MWTMPLHLHVFKKKTDDDNDNNYRNIDIIKKSIRVWNHEYFGSLANASR